MPVSAISSDKLRGPEGKENQIRTSYSIQPNHKSHFSKGKNSFSNTKIDRAYRTF